MTQLENFYDTQIEALYQVSRVLSRSLDFHQTLQAVLQVLHDYQNMTCGVVALRDMKSSTMIVGAIHGRDPHHSAEISYRPGEGLFGAIVAEQKTIVLDRLGDDPRFLNKLAIYNEDKPFIGVPIHIQESVVAGVLAVQPANGKCQRMNKHVRLVEMTANLIAQSVRLALEVESEKRNLRNECDDLRRRVTQRYGFNNVVGKSEPMRRVFELVRQVAPWNTTVLIRGESGTGKELIANSIHYNSPRSSGPLIKVNCAALPDNLLESELFGHEKGAFTGAINLRKGRFEQANTGTLFLDEIGDISPAFQVRLLRVLQEGEFERVGGNETIKVDVRVIAATNRNLEEMVDEEKFREDLYYRLNVMPIYLPPLRERPEDIPVLSDFLINKISQQQNRRLIIDDVAIRMLMQHSWPGNVRELENCLERSAIICTHNTIGERSLSIYLHQPSCSHQPTLKRVGNQQEPPLPYPLAAKASERDQIIAALEQSGWVQAKAARMLGMTPRQIAYRIQNMNIPIKKI
jgi:Nif-specific regulatory protein